MDEIKYTLLVNYCAGGHHLYWDSMELPACPRERAWIRCHIERHTHEDASRAHNVQEAA